MQSVALYKKPSQEIDLWEETMKEEAEGLTLELIPLDPIHGVDFRSHKFEE